MKSLLYRINSVIALTLAACITVALVLAIVYISNSTYKTVLHLEEEAMDQLTMQLTQSTENYIDSVVSLTHNLAGQEEIQSALLAQDGSVATAKDAESEIQHLLQVNDNNWAILVFDLQGDIVAGFNAQGKTLAGQSRSGREYVQQILDGKDQYVTKTVLDAASAPGTLILGASAAVKDDAGRTVGGVAVFSKWLPFTNEVLDPVRIAKEGYGFIIDGTGKILAHAVDKSLLLKDLSNHDFIQQALERKNGTLPYMWEGRKKFMSFHTLPETDWRVIMTAYESNLTAAATAQRNTLIIGGIVGGLVLVGLLLLILRRVVVLPVKGVLEYATAVAKGDLNARLQGRYHLEFAELAESIQHMVGELKEKLSFSEGVLKGITLPCVVVDEDNRITFANQAMLDILGKPGKPDDYLGQTPATVVYNDAGHDTTSQQAMDQRRMIQVEIQVTNAKGKDLKILATSTPFFDLDGELQGAVGLWMDLTDLREQQRQIEEQNRRIATAAEEASEISQNMASAAEELSSQVEEASRGAESQQERTSETATAMEQMNASVLEVARNSSTAAEGADAARHKAQEGNSIVERVVTSIKSINEKANSMKTSLDELGQKAQGIGQIMDVITDIADQTNLLALNAAIEAARAGEAGRGFAVVADEVRKLAEKTMSATTEVGSVVDAIQTSTRSNIQEMEQTAQVVAEANDLAAKAGDALREIVGIVNDTADQVRSIATAAEEQSSASEQINQATEQVNQISGETSQVMVESSKAVQEVADLARRLDEVIGSMQS